ncbi:MAG TPA: class I SAM-dependent methyltransferase [Pirellulaceae bacterium]|nr:class I SAM-dependent methyltransferase [Pirellulaceae bacterium]HMO91357.1 class I SAM-dependent methyltransferase [Pirellulaceae bacterium]HMP70251.1 class I SAM-dependent methyltransferase [Pirellulaceae bacterium]
MTSAESERIKQLQALVRRQAQQLQRLRDRVARLEKVWAFSIDDPEIRWLYENRSERMDATVPIFDEGRAEFHLARYRFAAQFTTGKHVVDIACGTGYGVRALVELGHAASVLGIDCCPEAIAYAQRKHSLNNTDYRIGTAEDTGLSSDEFDVAVSFETIEHLVDDQAFLRELARILKPDGLLICSTPNQWPLDIAPHHYRVYDYATFKELLSKYFQEVQFFNQNSGTRSPFNHGQPAGVVLTTPANQAMAECFLAVCKRKIKA